ncbi:MAG: hypothetical protein M3Q29_19825, partial [Chloroflexota bacterium]|nr:hypothetical protein [Chloroflexota bacterium]
MSTHTGIPNLEHASAFTTGSAAQAIVDESALRIVARGASTLVVTAGCRRIERGGKLRGMKAYAVDLRERVVAAVEAGMSKPEVA